MLSSSCAERSRRRVRDTTLSFCWSCASHELGGGWCVAVRQLVKDIGPKLNIQPMESLQWRTGLTPRSARERKVSTPSSAPLGNAKGDVPELSLASPKKKEGKKRA